MQYTRPYDFEGEAIAYLVACEGYTNEAAETEVMQHRFLEALKERAAKYTCKTKGHSFTNSSYAGPEGAADNFSCRRCGYTMKHIYF